MRLHAIFVLALALSAPVFAQEHAVPTKAKTATLMAGLGEWRHPVSTKNAQAQAFFDQGLRLIYAFNHDEAARSFQHEGARSKTGDGVLGSGGSGRPEL